MGSDSLCECGQPKDAHTGPEWPMYRGSGGEVLYGCAASKCSVFSAARQPAPWQAAAEKRAVRKARREAKKADSEALMDALGASVQADGTPRIPPPPKSVRKKRKKRKVPARKAAFRELKAACKAYVFARNKAINGGLCEIGLVCGGVEPADTWYHGWPQRGGNGLKYEVRSHFASCSRDNMGEYGERMRGGKRYENRHREILGPALFDELAALHGRKKITTNEARELAAEIRRKIESGNWFRNG